MGIMESFHKIPLKWAQTKDKIFLTLEGVDLNNQKMDIKPTGLVSFRGESKGALYGIEHMLFGELDIEKSKWNTKGRSVIFNLVKKESGPFWPRLLKDEKKDQTIKADWDKWIDEDEEEKKVEGDWDPEKMNDINPNQFGSDSDDDEEEAKPDLGDLDKEEKKEEPAKPAPEAEAKPPTEEKPAEEKAQISY
eukprot:TRINITY_DN5867_c0_g1_i4.p1 TRINITY_DN5867_c0_g1~~TRINITY_DN5867_c0_g1_i4.p1  ORF type:complete len:192 (-),score=54.54 TRINITY_DN5867_c0_g1_i4:51-626(-)